MTKVVELTSENFDSEVLASDVPVFVDFWAPWCGPCKALAPTIETLAAEYAGRIKVAKINVDEAEGIKEKYGVRSLPTLATFQSGEEVERIIGGQPLQRFKVMIDVLLGDMSSDAANEELRTGEFVDSLMGKGTIEDLQKILTEFPQFATAPIEVRGTSMRPMMLLLFKRDKERLDALLETNPELTHLDLLPSEEVEEALNLLAFSDYLMGKGSVDDMRQLLARYPHFADKPVELMGAVGQPMTVLLFRKDKDRAAVLLEHNPDLTPMEFAGLGMMDQLKCAIKEDPDSLDRPNEGGVTALVLAVMSEQLDTAKFLLEAGADPNFRAGGDGMGMPVNAAIMGGSVDLVELLVQHGGRVRPIGQMGFPVLHLAAVMGQADLVRCLIEHGLDPSEKDPRGQTVAELARSKGHEDLAAYVEKHIATKQGEKE